MRHYTAGHRLLPHDIVISWYMTFSLEDGTGGEGFLVAVALGQLWGLVNFRDTLCILLQFLLQ